MLDKIEFFLGIGHTDQAKKPSVISKKSLFSTLILLTISIIILVNFCKSFIAFQTRANYGSNDFLSMEYELFLLLIITISLFMTFMYNLKNIIIPRKKTNELKELYLIIDNKKLTRYADYLFYLFLLLTILQFFVGYLIFYR